MQLDDSSRHQELTKLIRKKGAMNRWYREIYAKYLVSLNQCPKNGLVLELGSGCGFAKDLIPEIITSDIIAYPGNDRIIDGTCIDFPDNSLRFICLLNVLHHISDAESFFREASRCLVPGGRIFIMDQYAGWISSMIFKHFHHEPFRPDAEDWRFESIGPLSGANGALSGIIFERDKNLFAELFPEFRILAYKPHTPIRYWLAGGIKAWSLLPGWAFPIATMIDKALLKISPKFGSFIDIELEKTALVKGHIDPN